MVKITGFCISAAIILVAGSASAQSIAHPDAKSSAGPVVGHAPKAHADPRPDVGIGPNGQPCIPSPISDNKALANVTPADMKVYQPPAKTADEEGDKKATVEPTDPPPSVGGGGDGQESGDVDEREMPTPNSSRHQAGGTTKPSSNSTQHQGTQTPVPGAGTQQCRNGH